MTFRSEDWGLGKGGKTFIREISLEAKCYLVQNSRREIKRNTLDIYCESINHMLTGGLDVGDEGKGKFSGLNNCMKWNTFQ